MQGGKPPCIPDSHLYTVTNTRCRIGTVFSPDDVHIVTRNMLESFRHFAITDNPTSVHNTYTVIDCLPATDAFYRREKIHACA